MKYQTPIIIILFAVGFIIAFMNAKIDQQKEEIQMLHVELWKQQMKQNKETLIRDTIYVYHPEIKLDTTILR